MSNTLTTLTDLSLSCSSVFSLSNGDFTAIYGHLKVVETVAFFYSVRGLVSRLLPRIAVVGGTTATLYITYKSCFDV